MKENIVLEARRIEEDSLYSAKSHFIMGLFYNKFYFWVGAPTAIGAAIAGESLLSLAIGGLTALMLFVNPYERACSHHSAGNKYNALRNRARIFYSIDCLKSVSVEDIAVELKRLDERRNELNLDSPQIPKLAYIFAKKGIAEGEADYKVDKRETNQGD